MRQTCFSRRSSFLAAASVLSLTIAAPAAADVPTGSAPVFDYDIVANHTVPPGPGNPATGANYANSPNVLSTGVNGVGQMITIVQPDPNSPAAFLGLCTGTLINPRTVITAAHCVFDAPAALYGSNTGAGGGLTPIVGLGETAGIPISFGFNSTNRCRGVSVNGCAVGQGGYETWRDSGFQTNTDKAIYNGNQVWYHPESTDEFGLGDVALVTLDTHAKDIPTWTLLFSPLDGPTHATITGYGGAGVGSSGIGDAAGIDYRRRAAENMIDALMSSYDWLSSPAIFGDSAPAAYEGHQHSLYWYDFDDPDWSVFDAATNPNFFNPDPNAPRDNGYYDFNGLGGTALTNEGATAGGDSGGPLIVDQRWDKPVVAGVLTGSWSFGGNTNYGEFSVYPPLFLYWEQIVQNNPYVYASAKAGNGDWFDPTHWVQDMDPNYAIIGPNGELLTGLPDVAQLDHDSSAGRFGTVCFLEQSCADIASTAFPTGDGSYVVTAGGPGSTNFVPNNVEPVNSLDPKKNVKARYYDVTLGQAGRTTLGGTATIDVLTLDNARAHLNITGGGTLNTWADYTQYSGWVNVDGALNTHEMLVVSGLVSGSGLINPDFLTVGFGGIAPGSITPSGTSHVGTMTVSGNVILTSASSLFIELTKNKGDLLNVVADADNDGALSLAGTLYVGQGLGATPRHGQKFTVASAQGGVSGTFGTTAGSIGVLQPTVSYDPNNVYVSLKAGSLAKHVGSSNASVLAFANALDALRTGSYTDLYNLYGSVDVMGAAQLGATLSSLTPRVVGDAAELQDRQSRQLMSTVTDRLSLIGTGRAKGLSLVGAPFAALAANSGVGVAPSYGFGASGTSAVTVSQLPGKLTGFMSGGVERTRASYGEHSFSVPQGGWHMAMGLEMPLGDTGTVGTAVGMAEGESSPAGDSNRSRTTMAAAYAAVPLGDGFYAGAMLSAETARASVERQSTDGIAALRLTGATSASRYSAVAEAGYVADIGRGLTLTPRAQLGYGHYTLNGFSETGGETALKLSDVSVTRMEARLGAKLEGSTNVAGLKLTPQISADYVSLLSGRETGAMVRFAAAPGESFYLPLSESGSGWTEVKGGVTIEKGPFSLGLSGQHAVGGSGMSEERAQADFRFRF